MASHSSRPRLRPIETIIVPDSTHGRLLVLRDTQGVTDAHAAIPAGLIPIVARFEGRLTCTEIAQEVSRQLGEEVPTEIVVKIASDLESALFIEGPEFDAANANVHRAFANARMRPASHAGGAYANDPKALRSYIDDKCIAQAASETTKNINKKMVALIAPHIDPWRGAAGYGHAYASMRAHLPDDADTFILFGTSHAPMQKPFSICRKAFDTPLGPIEADTESIDAIAAASPFDVYADEFNHKREHSIEFQVVFLRHLLGTRRATIIPILAGLGEHQSRGIDPANDASVTQFLDAVRRVMDEKKGRVVVVAGADMAHMGPRFGDATALDEAAREDLDRNDRTSLAHAVDRDTPGFWSHVARDLEERRVCGLAPIYSLLRTTDPSAKGELLHYEQTIDPDEGSIVSHAAIGFFSS